MNKAPYSAFLEKERNRMHRDAQREAGS